MTSFPDLTLHLFFRYFSKKKFPIMRKIVKKLVRRALLWLPKFWPLKGGASFHNDQAMPQKERPAVWALAEINVLGNTIGMFWSGSSLGIVEGKIVICLNSFSVPSTFSILLKSTKSKTFRINIFRLRNCYSCRTLKRRIPSEVPKFRELIRNSTQWVLFTDN